MQQETRQFTVAPSIINHLIKAQAGSLGKAILECVQNSIDAGASRVDIQLELTGATINDDGHGLRSREEILAVFETFGFDHANHAREFGRFGLGRGQLWAWASTKWRTATFLLDVDVRARGLDWNLTSDLPPQAGVAIEARFYEPLTQVQLASTVNDLQRLCRYSAVPVLVNGQQLSKDPAKDKWTHTTEEAYLRVTEGHSLSVYNQGLHVCDIYTGRAGIAGTLVTKRGHALTLNMARNDILRAECPLWKKLQVLISQKADERRGKGSATRMTAADRDYLAQQSADPALIANLDQPIFTLSNGRHVSFVQMARAAFAAGALSVAPSGDRTAEKLLRDRSAQVLAELTLQRFGVTSVRELVRTLLARIDAAENKGWEVKWYADKLRGDEVKTYEDLSQCPGYQQLQANKITADKLTDEQRQLLFSAQGLSEAIAGIVGTDVVREVILADAPGADAYTDGSSFVAIEQLIAKQDARAGLAGFVHIAHLILHEYLHDNDTAGSHAHDHEFYERYHDLVLDEGHRIHAAVAKAYKAYVSKLTRLTKKQAVGADLVTKAPPGGVSNAGASVSVGMGTMQPVVL